MEIIVAIELGSSKMTGIAGKKNPDGSITILAVAQEPSASCIRKGVVYNIDKTAQSLNQIINKLKLALKSEITQVYVCVGGQSIRSVRNVITKNLPADTIISQGMVNELMDANRNMTYPEYKIIDAVTQEYKVDAQYQIDPVGIQAAKLEGNFLNILWRNSFYRSLNKCFDNAGIKIADMCLAPLAMADAVLTEAEKRAGCLLVDLGAGTTTVSIYYRGLLRHIAVIPLGGDNVTKDIESLQIDAPFAEEMKLKYAKAFTEPSDIDPSRSYPIGDGRSVDCCRFIDIVEARVKEIIENVWAQVPPEFADKLLAGIVLTGGGANMKEIEKAFRLSTNIAKIRIARFVGLSVSPANSKVPVLHDGTMNTVIALVAKGDISCVGSQLGGDLFAKTGKADSNASLEGTRPEQPSQAEFAERNAQAEAERLRKEEEERIAKQKAEEQKRLEEEEKKKNSPFKRFVRSVKNFGRTLVEPENNE